MQKETKKAIIRSALSCLVLAGLAFLAVYLTPDTPITFRLHSVGDFFLHFFDNFIYYPVGFLLWKLTCLCGGYYAVGLALLTLLFNIPAFFAFMLISERNIRASLAGDIDTVMTARSMRQADREKRLETAQQKMIFRRYLSVMIMGIFLFAFTVIAYIVCCRYPYTPAWTEGVHAEILGFDLFSGISREPIQLTGFLCAVAYTAVSQFFSVQKLTGQAAKQTTKEAESEDKRFFIRRLSVIATTVFGIVIWLNEKGLLFFLPQDILRVVGYAGLCSSIIMDIYSALTVILRHRAAAKDESLYLRRAMPEMSPPETVGQQIGRHLPSLFFLFPLLLLSEGGFCLYYIFNNLLIGIYLMFQEIGFAERRKKMYEKYCLTIDKFRAAYSGMLEQYQYIAYYLREIYTSLCDRGVLPAQEGNPPAAREIAATLATLPPDGAGGAFADFDHDALRALFEKKAYWTDTCYLDIEVEEDTGRIQQNENIMSIYQESRDAFAIRGALSRIHATLTAEDEQG